jgi:hypothetical protein
MINVFFRAIVPACSPIHQGQAPMIDNHDDGEKPVDDKNDGWESLCKKLLKQKTRLFTGGSFHAVGFG